MDFLLTGLCASIICVGLSFLLTPMVGAFANKIGFVDRPDAKNKLHPKDVPLGGGVVVWLSVAATLATLFLCGGAATAELLSKHAIRLPVLLSTVVILVIGLTDDCYQISSRYKLLGQFCAALLVVGAFPVPDSIRVADIEIKLGLLAGPFAIAWMVGGANAINLIDGVDGFATVISVSIGLTLAAVAAVLGHPVVALTCVVTIAAMAGFARFNVPPARIFLGDAGSLLVGWVLALATLRGTQDGPSTMLLVPALAIWTIPIFDSLIAIVRRATKGTSIWLGDRQHVHHCLVARLGCPWRVLRWAGYGGLVVGLPTVLSVHLATDLVALGAAGTLIAIAVASRTFGYSEICQLFELLRRRVAWVSTHAFPRIGSDGLPLASPCVSSEVRPPGAFHPGGWHHGPSSGHEAVLGRHWVTGTDMATDMASLPAMAEFTCDSHVAAVKHPAVFPCQQLRRSVPDG